MTNKTKPMSERFINQGLGPLLSVKKMTCKCPQCGKKYKRRMHGWTNECMPRMTCGKCKMRMIKGDFAVPDYCFVYPSSHGERPDDGSYNL